MNSHTIKYKEDEFTICEFGATLLSYKRKGEELLFLSEKALLDGSKPIRGGVPIVFPVFGESFDASLPKHGFSRQTMWKLKRKWHGTHESGISFELKSNVDTRIQWNYDFSLNLDVILNNEELKMILSIHNESLSPFEFECLFHTYLRVDNIMNTKVFGLPSKHYNQLTQKVECSKKEVLEVGSEVDSIYTTFNNDIVMKNNEKILNIASENDDINIVVWNTWIDKSISLNDFEDEEYRNMICLELGVLNIDPLNTEKHILRENEKFVFTQIIC
jgi:D-hexose-6-phosphate mutarotase